MQALEPVSSPTFARWRDDRRDLEYDPVMFLDDSEGVKDPPSARACVGKE